VELQPAPLQNAGRVAERSRSAPLFSRILTGRMSKGCSHEMRRILGQRPALGGTCGLLGRVVLTEVVEWVCCVQMADQMYSSNPGIYGSFGGVPGMYGSIPGAPVTYPGECA
jgi:hypothetical protein